ncbi:MAG: sulfatase-like hydrolase/transferase, partial [Sedimentisphaerales bacterium]|nr:sulfatase-like hydrolase/transferase [Sedimentisphaerales bacterium]
MLDDGRADALGCYGKNWAKTPHLDRLAERGVRFATAVVQNPVCVPSRTSMKTG